MNTISNVCNVLATTKWNDDSRAFPPSDSDMRVLRAELQRPRSNTECYVRGFYLTQSMRSV